MKSTGTSPPPFIILLPSSFLLVPTIMQEEWIFPFETSDLPFLWVIPPSFPSTITDIPPRIFHYSENTIWREKLWIYRFHSTKTKLAKLQLLQIKIQRGWEPMHVTWRQWRMLLHLLLLVQIFQSLCLLYQYFMFNCMKNYR